jgi:uncharacterized cupin superfamily protein
MTRPTCAVNTGALPSEEWPHFASTVGIAATVCSPSDATGLTRMGVHVRAVKPGFADTNRHFHTVEEEWFYVLAGRGTVRIGPFRVAVSPGHFIGFPPGPRPHHFINDGTETLVLLDGGWSVRVICWETSTFTTRQGTEINGAPTR